MSRARLRLAWLGCLVLFFWPAWLAGQQFRGTITGLILDQQGAVIPGVKVTATQEETGARSETLSSGEGRYTLPFLSPGVYRVEVDAPGFKRYVRSGLRVSTNEQVTLDITLELGQTTETVTVTAETPLLITATASTGQVINQRHVEYMPLNGRTPLVLAQLSYGVIPNTDPRFYRPFDDGGPSNFSMGGAPRQNNELLLDGAPNASVGGGNGFSPPVDAVEEVKVESFQADAAYGHSGGGTVNILTKAGTNAFHGTMYEFNQVSALGANLFFANRAGQKKNVSNYNQWGATAGGPVMLPRLLDGRNRVFFFFAYEGINQKMPRATDTTVPTAEQREGNFSKLLALGPAYQLYDPATGVREGSRVRRQPFPGNVIPGARIHPVARRILAFYDLPNQPGKADGTNNFFVGAVGEFNTFDSEMGRLDFNLSSRHKLFYQFRHNDRLLRNGTTFSNNATEATLTQINWSTGIDDVFTISPTTVLNTRLHWLRNSELRLPLSLGFDITSLGFSQALARESAGAHFPRVTVSGLAELGSSRGGGIYNPYDSFQLFSSLSKTVSAHTLKLGGEVRLLRRNRYDKGQSSGAFEFSTNWTRGPLDNSPAAPTGQGLASLLLGLPTGGYWDVNAAESSQNAYLSLFLQDDLRLRASLTLNLGLRYEKELPTTERFNRSTNGFDFNSPSPISAQAAAAYARNPIPEIPPSAFKTMGGLTFASPQRRRLFETPPGVFGPRVGFAWTPGALGGKTVLRGGMGLFYFPLDRPGTGIDQTGFSQQTPVVPTQDNYLTPYATLSNPFPDGILKPVGSALGLATYLGRSVGFFTPDVKPGYSLRWNFNIQRQLPRNALLELGYLYNHGVRLSLNRQIDFVPAQYLSTKPVRDQEVINRLTAAVPNPFAGLMPGTTLNGATIQRSQLLRPYPHFTGITERTTPVGGSYFHMLQVRFEKRLSEGVQLLANYLYSKLIERRSWLNDCDPLPEKRIASDDRPQRLVISLNWELPFGQGKALGKDAPRAVRALISGWVINAIYTTQPGSPLSWGNVIYYGGDLKLNPRRIDQAFDVTRFNRNPQEQLANNIRTFPSQFANLRQDGVNNMDLSVVKDNRIGEKINLQLRCEFFNFMNHPSFNAPNLSPTSSAFGTITSQANLARSTQLALRLVW